MRTYLPEPNVVSAGSLVINGIRILFNGAKSSITSQKYGAYPRTDFKQHDWFQMVHKISFITRFLVALYLCNGEANPVRNLPRTMIRMIMNLIHSCYSKDIMQCSLQCNIGKMNWTCSRRLIHSFAKMLDSSCACVRRVVLLYSRNYFLFV